MPMTGIALEVHMTRLLAYPPFHIVYTPLISHSFLFLASLMRMSSALAFFHSPMRQKEYLLCTPITRASNISAFLPKVLDDRDVVMPCCHQGNGFFHIYEWGGLLKKSDYAKLWIWSRNECGIVNVLPLRHWSENKERTLITHIKQEIFLIAINIKANGGLKWDP